MRFAVGGNGVVILAGRTAESIEEKLDPAGDPHFVEYAKHVVLNCVSTQFQSLGNFLIRHCLRQAVHYFQFPRRELVQAYRIEGAHCGRDCQCFEQKSKLLTAGPDLPPMYATDALPQYFDR